MQSRMAEVLSQWTLASLAESPPDLVLSLAQAPLTLPVLEHLRKKNFVTAMWFVENYRHLTYWQQMAPGYDYWFVFQRGQCPDAFRQAGAKNVSYLPMAADPTIHHPMTLSEEDRRDYGADVSFVGAGYANRRRLFPHFFANPGHSNSGAMNGRARMISNPSAIERYTNRYPYLHEGLQRDDHQSQSAFHDRRRGGSAGGLRESTHL